MRKTAFLSGLILLASSVAFITPSAQADPPQANDDIAMVYTGKSVEIDPLANDSGGLTITSAAPTADHGAVACTDVLCTYSSTAGYVGPDSFDYTASDGVDTATATVFVTVNADPVTSITLTPPASGVIGTSQTISASATLASSGPADGEPFELWGWPTGAPASAVKLADAGADSSGAITFDATPTAASTTLEVRWVDDDTVRSNSVTWTAVPAPDPVETITLTQPAVGTIGTSQVITGTATLHSGAAAAGQQFGLWGAEVNVGTATANSSGEITFNLAPTAASTTLQIRWTDDDTVRSNTATWTALVPITAVSMKVTRPISTWPSPATFTGTITPKLADRTVSLQAQTPGSGGWVTVTSGVTDANGVVRLSAAPMTFTFYRLSAGTAINSGSSPVFVTPALTVLAKKKGKYDVLTGRVTPTRKGTPIKLQRKLPGKQWKTVKSLKATKAVVTGSLNRGYAYSFKIKGTKGRISYRVWLPTDKGRDEAFSPKRAVRR